MRLYIPWVEARSLFCLICNLLAYNFQYAEISLATFTELRHPHNSESYVCITLCLCEYIVEDHSQFKLVAFVTIPSDIPQFGDCWCLWTPLPL